MDIISSPFGNGGSGDCGLPGQLPGRAAGTARSAFGQASASTISMRWSALHDAAAAVAALAGIKPEPMEQAARNFPVVMRVLAGWRRNLAEQGVDDLAAIMEPGLAALLAVHARGGDARCAARALWTEFVAARDGLLALLPEGGTQPPLRSA